MTPAVLLVLAKAPHAGKVKTRLCPPCHPEQAARIAAAALLDTLDAVRAVPGTTPVVALAGAIEGASDEAAIADALSGVTVLAQRGDGLGARIAAAHADTAARFPGSPVVQIGMDTPQVTAALLAECLGVLDEPGTGAALGMAADGGWWALGLRDPRQARHLTAVPTSVPETGRLTEKALRDGGLSVAELPGLSDVDTEADARTVAGLAPATRFATMVRKELG